MRASTLSPLAPLLATLLVIGAGSASIPARADVWPPFRGTRAETSYSEDGKHGFLVGGIGFWSGSNVLFGNAWSIGGGMKLPMRSWAIVPRLDAEGGSDGASSAWMVRGNLGGRITTLVGGRASFIEGGVGAAYYELTNPVLAYDALETQYVESGATPIFVLGTGVTSDPDVHPGFVLELQVVGAMTSEAPSSVLFRFGVEF